MGIKTAFDFTGRTVPVVGASRGGIGSAIAAGFTECGALVRITGAESKPIAADQGRYLTHNLMSLIRRPSNGWPTQSRHWMSS